MGAVFPPTGYARRFVHPAMLTRGDTPNRTDQERNGRMSSATTFTSFNIGLMAGPAVSL
jgi:hypothetical protein